MNYYPFHLGDYAAHTGHLEPMEDLAYRRLLDQYYLREGPLPPDIEKLAKLIRMKGFAADVETVLREFFTLSDQGWSHTRCDVEISKMRDRQDASEEREEHEKTRMQRHRERRAAMFAHLRALGIVPAWDIKIADLQRLYDANGGPAETAPVTPVTPHVTHQAPSVEHPTGYAPATPETAPERPPAVSGDAPATAIPTPTPTPTPTPEGKKGETRSRASTHSELRPDDVSVQVWTDWVALRKAKKTTVSETVIREARTEAGKAHISLERFLSIWCIRGSQGLQAKWLESDERGPQGGTNGSGARPWDGAR